MNLLNLAFAFVFISNFIFMAGAGYVLWRLLVNTENAKVHLRAAVSQSNDASQQLKAMAKSALGDMERLHEARVVRENAHARSLGELTSQVKALGDQMQFGGGGGGAGDAGKGKAASDDGATARAIEDARAKLHAELIAALSKNHQLQEDIETTKQRLKEASRTNQELRLELSETKGIKQQTVDNLVQRTMELHAQLQDAQERVMAAEKHARANASQMQAVRGHINEAQFGNAAGGGESDDNLRDLIDVLAAREKALLARIAEMEQAFERAQTEKNFIEDRFLEMDPGQAS